jgi:hypothetical protein
MMLFTPSVLHISGLSIDVLGNVASLDVHTVTRRAAFSSGGI